MDLHVGVLGPVEVERDGELVAISGRKERALLTTLAVRAGSILTAEQLIDVLWADDPPPSARSTLRSYISRLRHVLGDALVSRANGYALDLDDNRVDAKRFEKLVEEGTNGGNPAALGEALELWRGEPLADLVDSSRGQAEARRLVDLRLAAVVGYAEWRLEQGDVRGVLGTLEREIAEHPYQEVLSALLVRGFIADGRRADALRAYQRARNILVGELGLEPGPELRAAEALALQDASGPGQNRLRPAGTGGPLSQVANWPLVGRDEELAALRMVWDEARQGGSGSASVIGEPGMGKTRLLAELIGHVRAEEGIALYGYGDPTLPLPLGPILTAVRPLVPRSMTASSPELDALFGTGDAAVLGRFGDGQRLRLHRQLTDLVTAEASEVPICLILEDLHWADDSTVAVLRHLVRLPARQLAIVISSRPVQAAAPIVALLDELAGTTHHRRLVLGPVDRGAARRIAGRHLPDGRAVDDIVDRAGGLPLLLVELARSPTSPPTAEGDEVSNEVQAAVQRRLSGMPPDLVELLRTAAVFGPEFDLDALAALNGAAADDIAARLDPAVIGGLLDEATDRLGRYHFSHVVVADALQAGLGRNALAALHRRAARALALLATDPADSQWVRAAHHLESGGGHDSGVFMAAARLSARRADHQRAIQWFEAGLADPQLRDPTRAELLIGLGEARDRVMVPGARAAYLEAIEIADSAGDDTHLVEAVLGLTRYNQARSVASRDEEVIAAIQLARDRNDPNDHIVAARLAAAECAELMWTAPGEQRQALRDRAIDEARSSSDPSLLGEIAALTYFSAGSPDDVGLRRTVADEALRALGDGEDSEAAVFARIAGAYAAFELGEVGQADRLAEEAAELVEQHHHLALAWRVTTLRTALAMFHGELDRAQRLIEAVATESRNIGSPQDMLVARAMGQLSFERGDLEPLCSVLDAIVTGETVEGWRSARAYILAEVGRIEEASVELDDLVRKMPRSPRTVGWLTHRCGEALTAATLGDVESARVLASALMPFRELVCVDVIASMGPVAYSAGRASVTAGPVDLGRQLLQEAASFAERNSAPQWQARAEAALSAAS